MKIEGMKYFNVWCDSNIAGSGWTVIQRRIDGKVGFKRNWADYKEGFGELGGNFWLGLEKLQKITNGNRYELYIQLVDLQGEFRYARYGHFKVGSESENYTLISIGKYSGDAGDSLAYNVGKSFSTYDKANDSWRDRNCARREKCGWWYKYCGESNLNGKFFDCDTNKTGSAIDGCIYWYTWHGMWNFIKSVQMMIRPIGSQ